MWYTKTIKGREHETMSKSKKQVKTFTEIFQSERKSWGNVNPVTRVIPDKRRKPPKHKGRQWDE